jgi:hypothetical protein
VLRWRFPCNPALPEGFAPPPHGFKRRAASGKTVIIFNIHQNLNHEKKSAFLLASGKCPQVLQVVENRPH